MVNGFIVDASDPPLKVQFQAYEKGLIPYVPSLQIPIVEEEFPGNNQ